jgi:hypothetical protein
LFPLCIHSSRSSSLAKIPVVHSRNNEPPLFCLFTLYIRGSCSSNVAQIPLSFIATVTSRLCSACLIFTYLGRVAVASPKFLSRS